MFSRTLRTMERYGLVRFEPGEGKARIPRAPYSEITLDVPLSGLFEARHIGSGDPPRSQGAAYGARHRGGRLS
jgi:hypothetical protein